MKLKTILFGFLAVSLALIFTLVAPTGDVRADDGQLTARINGVDVSEYNSPSNALEVYNDEILYVDIYAPSYIQSHRIKMAFVDDLYWTVSDEVDDGDSYYYSEIVEVEAYADYGVGVYKIKAWASTENDSYYKEAYIKVIGGSFLDSWIGIVALALFCGGSLTLLAMLLIIFRGAGSAPITFGLLLPVLPFAVLATSEDSQSSESGDTLQAPSSGKNTSEGGTKFRPRISILSIISALLAAIGLVVMLQQMGTVYPTITIVVLSLVLALVAGILLPSFAQMFARRK